MSIADTAPSATAPAPTFSDADRATLDGIVEQLQDGERAWAALDLRARAALLMRVHD